MAEYNLFLNAEVNEANRKLDGIDKKLESIDQKAGNIDIKFPNLYERVLERLSIVNVDMSFSLECILERRVTYQDRLLAATIGPVAVILVVIVSVEIIL